VAGGDDSVADVIT